MRRILLVVAVTLPLGGCVTPSQGTVDTAVSIFNRVCQFEPAAHSVFLSVAPGRVSDAVLRYEAKSHLFVASTCASRPTDVNSAIAALSKAYADVVNAKDHAVELARAEGVVVPIEAPPAP